MVVLCGMNSKSRTPSESQKTVTLFQTLYCQKNVECIAGIEPESSVAVIRYANHCTTEAVYNYKFIFVVFTSDNICGVHYYYLHDILPQFYEGRL